MIGQTHKEAITKMARMGRQVRCREYLTCNNSCLAGHVRLPLIQQYDKSDQDELLAYYALKVCTQGLFTPSKRTLKSDDCVKNYELWMNR